MYNPSGSETKTFSLGEEATIRISALFKEPVKRPIIGVTLRNPRGVDIVATNTFIENVPLPPAGKGDLFTVSFRFQVPGYFPNHYSLSPAVAEGVQEQHVACDWIDNAYIFHVLKTQEVIGIHRIPFNTDFNIVKNF
jgi:hypothetical protein